MQNEVISYSNLNSLIGKAYLSNQIIAAYAQVMQKMSSLYMLTSASNQYLVGPDKCLQMIQLFPAQMSFNAI